MNERKQACKEYADMVGQPLEELFPEFAVPIRPEPSVTTWDLDNIGDRRLHFGGLPVTGATIGGSFIRK